MQSKFLPLVAGFSLLLLPMVSAEQTQAQAKLCSSDGNYEPRSPTSRTVRLPDFGLEVDIPSNYRAMRRQNGRRQNGRRQNGQRQNEQVVILHPDDFAMLHCIANGGYGGHGYYSESIELVERDRTLSLKDQAIGVMGYSTDAAGNRQPIAVNVLSYDRGDLSGYIATANTNYAVVFTGTLPGHSQLLQVSAVCDCEVEVEDVTRLLSKIRLMK